MDGATLTVHIDFDDFSQKPAAYRTKLSRAVLREMQPVDVCSDSMAALLSGAHAVTLPEYKVKIVPRRQELAKMIADAITNNLMDYMESRDKENGYTKRDLT